MLNKIKFALLIIFCLSTSASQAAVSPLSFGLLPPLQFPPSNFTVTGARASILWGQHRDLYGFDLGVIGNITDQRFLGVAASGIFNLTRGETTIIGLQLAGGANVNVNKTGVYGLQLALGVNSNQAESSVAGLQVAALANISPFTTIYGAQLGLYNRAQVVYGFQLGLVNVASSLHGIQIGLMNFHQQGLVSVSPIINIGF